MKGKRKMALFVLGLGLVVTFLGIVLVTVNKNFAQSDRYVMMRVTLMRIAEGRTEDASATAQATLDAVNTIDDERVRMFYD